MDGVFQVKHRGARSLLAVHPAEQVDTGGRDITHPDALRPVHEFNGRLADPLEGGIIVRHLDVLDGLGADELPRQVHQSEPDGVHPDIDPQEIGHRPGHPVAYRLPPPSGGILLPLLLDAPSLLEFVDVLGDRRRRIPRLPGNLLQSEIPVQDNLLVDAVLDVGFDGPHGIFCKNRNNWINSPKLNEYFANFQICGCPRQSYVH